MHELPERFRPIAEWLQAFAASTPGVVAAYVGGSLVNDRIDDDSDLDANIATTPADRDAVFDALRRRLQSDWDATDVWVLPTPTAHGGLQLFARVGRPPLIVDIVVDEDKPELVDIDARRHGRPVVLHDPDGRLRIADEDDDELRTAAEEAVRRIAERLPYAEWMILKAVRRGHWPEAYAYYLRFGIEALVLLLRAKHTPARWDFGLRYLDDLPGEVSARVDALLPTDRERLASLTDECLAWQRELLEELRRESA